MESVLDNIDSSGRWRERIYVTGVNGSKEGYNAVLSGTADGVMVMDLDEIGKAAVTVAEKLIKNENVEKNHNHRGEVLYNRYYKRESRAYLGN